MKADLQIDNNIIKLSPFFGHQLNGIIDTFIQMCARYFVLRNDEQSWRETNNRFEDRFCDKSFPNIKTNIYIRFELLS